PYSPVGLLLPVAISPDWFHFVICVGLSYLSPYVHSPILPSAYYFPSLSVLYYSRLLISRVTHIINLQLLQNENVTLSIRPLLCNLVANCKSCSLEGKFVGVSGVGILMCRTPKSGRLLQYAMSEQEVHTRLHALFGEATLSKTQVYDWRKNFFAGRESVENKLHQRRQRTSITADNIRAVRDLIEEDRRITSSEITSHVGISFGSVQAIIRCDTGFGNKLARQLDRKGITVYAGCLFSEGEGASQLRKDCSKNVHIVQIDVTKHDQVSAAVKYVINSLNGKTLHALVNNAGIFSASEGEFIEMEELRRVLEVNTIGVARVTQAFLPLLRKSKGRLVFTASVASFINLPGFAAYAMSKHAVLAYATTIRRELMRWSVSVHTIEPLIYNTEMKNKSVILSRIDSGFTHAPEETREEYGGDEYVKAYTTSCDILDHLYFKRIEDVTDCMMDAIIAKYPKARYHPGVAGRIHFWLTRYTFQEIKDMFIYLIIHFFVGNIHDAGKKYK
ncbi:hypothetical protein L9F63_017383, partial [Diploptera punctata]